MSIKRLRTKRICPTPAAGTSPQNALSFVLLMDLSLRRPLRAISSAAAKISTPLAAEFSKGAGEATPTLLRSRAQSRS